jgi:hypothetical protein
MTPTPQPTFARGQDSKTDEEWHKRHIPQPQPLTKDIEVDSTIKDFPKNKNPKEFGREWGNKKAYLTTDIKSALSGLKHDIDGKTYYPLDIFPAITSEQYLAINELLIAKLGITIDRLAANLIRRKADIDLEAVDKYFEAFKDD